MPVNCKVCQKELIMYSNVHFGLCLSCNKKRLKKNKGQSKLVKLNEVKDEVQDRKKLGTCLGCNKSLFNLDRSHIIPISIAPDLKFEKENIQPLCRSCHTKWEHGPNYKRKQLNCYETNLEIIKKLKPAYYERLIQKK